MAIAARSPAPPPPTSSTSWAAAAPSLTLRLLNVDPPGVPRDRPGHAAVMERFADDAAAAGVKLHPRHWRPSSRCISPTCTSRPTTPCSDASRTRAAQSRLIAAADAHATPEAKVDADHAFDLAHLHPVCGAGVAACPNGSAMTFTAATSRSRSGTGPSAGSALVPALVVPAARPAVVAAGAAVVVAAAAPAAAGVVVGLARRRAGGCGFRAGRGIRDRCRAIGRRLGLCRRGAGLAGRRVRVGDHAFWSRGDQHPGHDSQNGRCSECDDPLRTPLHIPTVTRAGAEPAGSGRCPLSVRHAVTAANPCSEARRPPLEVASSLQP